MKKNSLYSLIFTIFNDALGWGVVLTIFAPLLMNDAGRFLSADTSLQMKTMILGLLIACYPLTQFFFMPVIGALSDHMGRKKILEWTILCAALTSALSAIAIWRGSLFFLFVSRILAGVFSANSATAQAAIADMSSEREKGKNLSLSGIAGGLSWVVGPPLGGILSTNEYLPWADFATPFWFVAALFLINYWWVLRSFEETFVKKGTSHNWKQEIKDLSKLSKIPHMTPWLAIMFFFFLGWGFYLLFYPTLLVQRFSLDQSAIGLMSGYLSIFWLLTSTSFNRGLAEKFKPEAFVLLGLPMTGLLVIVLVFAPSIAPWWYLLFPFIAFGGSSIWISLLAFTSNLAGRENQGKVFGIGQSLFALATCISPIVSGLLAATNELIPLLIGGVILLAIGCFALLYYFKRHPRKGAS